MRLPRVTPVKALAALLGLAVILTPATMASAAKKAPAKKACSLKKKAKCKKAKLVKVKVGKVNLAGTDLRGAVITGATFNGTNLSGVNLSGAKISDTTFTGANVANLSLAGATLSNVTFSQVTLGAGQRGSATEHDCTSVDPSQDDLDDTSTKAYTCTGGGIIMRGAVLENSVTFADSTIPGSDFSGMTATKGLPRLQLRGTNARGSTFPAAATRGFSVMVSTSSGVKSTGTFTDVSGSVLNWVILGYWERTKARNATFVGALPFLARFGPLDDVDVQGSRGLNGVAAVTIAGPGGVIPPGLRTVQIREDGYFRPGVLCESLPCTRSTVAVGAPVIATAAGTAPLVLALPGWDCAAPDPTVIDGVTVYRSTCSIAKLPAGDVSGTLTTVPVPRVHVSVNGDAGTPASPTAVSQMSLVIRAPGSSSSETVNCAETATCAADVLPGSTVAVRARDTTRVVSLQCPGESDLRMASAGNEVTCPAYAVESATSVRLAAQPGALLHLTAVDSGNFALATPITTLRIWARPAGFSVGATINCDGRSVCNGSIPVGSAVRVSIGDVALDTSGFCPGPDMQFHIRYPGAVGVCSEYTFAAAENFRIETAVPLPPG